MRGVVQNVARRQPGPWWVTAGNSAFRGQGDLMISARASGKAPPPWSRATVPPSAIWAPPGASRLEKFRWTSHLDFIPRDSYGPLACSAGGFYARNCKPCSFFYTTDCPACEVFASQTARPARFFITDCPACRFSTPQTARPAGFLHHGLPGLQGFSSQTAGLRGFSSQTARPADFDPADFDPERALTALRRRPRGP